METRRIFSGNSHPRAVNPDQDDQIGVLVVDDEAVIRLLFQAFLADTAYPVGVADSAGQALEKMARDPYNLLIVDKNLPGRSGLDLMREVQGTRPETEFIVITGYASYESAIEALRMGAFDYLEKPFDDMLQVKKKVDRALEQQRQVKETRLLADQLRTWNTRLRSGIQGEGGGPPSPELPGEISKLRTRVSQAARSLQQAYHRFRALGDNQLVPAQPSQDIQTLLEQTWAYLSVAAEEEIEISLN